MATLVWFSDINVINAILSGSRSCCSHSGGWNAGASPRPRGSRPVSQGDDDVDETFERYLSSDEVLRVGSASCDCD